MSSIVLGVEQRSKLWKKNTIHKVMTATPIPRTLAMSFYTYDLL
jgi:RecG-like helicase